MDRQWMVRGPGYQALSGHRRGALALTLMMSLGACGDDAVTTAATATGTTGETSTTDDGTTAVMTTTTASTTTAGGSESATGTIGETEAETETETTETTATTGDPMGICGDGVIDRGEECDEGRANDDSAACTSACKEAICGDGLVWEGVEACDDGPANADNAACTSTCEEAVCGDGLVWEGVEECDDGNDIDDDGCSNECLLPFCGNGIVEGDEECDDGNQDDNDACTNMCTEAICGDAIVWEGVEECDLGEENSDQGACTSMCMDAVCGDGLVHEGVEECDLGEENSDQGACTSMCMDAVCGDGLVHQGVEECDDGNIIDGDGCSSECLKELRPNLLRCGSSSRDVMVMAQGLNLTLEVGCTPNSSHQAMLVTRSGHNSLNADTLKAYLEGGGIVLTEYSNSDDVFSLAFTPVPQGNQFGACRDVAPTVVQFALDDPFWAANPWQAITPGETGCGRAIQAFPGVTVLAGWDNTNASIGYRDLGAGRLWLTDYDWQDNENYPFEYTASLMNYMISHAK